MAQFQPYPSNLRSSKELIDDVVLETFSIETLGTPFQLPRFSKTFENIAAFVALDTKVQLELLREELNQKAYRVTKTPKEERDDMPAEKHCRFPMPAGALHQQTCLLTLPSTLNVHKVPPRSQWANYFVVLQTKDHGDTMQHIALAFCSHFRKGGVLFRICRRDMARLRRLVPPGTELYARPLANCSFRKTHFRAIQELGDSALLLERSPVTKHILKGHLDTDIKTVDQLDEWAQGAFNVNDFNRQQKRALALDALTKEGIVLIQGPPGTGKSHILCHGLIPQAAVERKERVLVICNSNVAVDALMLKCLGIQVLQGKMVRCGFKSNISDEIVNKGLYAEGDATASLDRYGKGPGSNSNTNDRAVRQQIQSKAVVFTTIHFASKDKGTAPSSYWNFDTLVLDEAAQIEDSKLFILLARCPTLKKIILVGDPKQLQPYVSESLRQQGHGKSTMERLMESHESPSDNSDTAPYVMLQCQFRMAPLLRGLVSELFYDNRLEDAQCVLSRGPIESVPLTPMLVIDLTGTKMSFSKLHQSYENVAEARIVKEIYNFLLSAEFEGVLNTDESLTGKDICVLSPFNRQKDVLRSEICGASLDDLDAHSGHVFGRSLLSPVKKSQSLSGMTADDGEVTAEQAAQLENIDTVDKFQGSERKVVIISACVDTRPLRAADPHFINVACSRAQHLLIVVGNFKDALSSDPNWSRVKAKATQDGSCIEHVVNLTAGNGDGVKDNLNVPELLTKLSDLVEGKPKRRRRGLLDLDNE